MIDHISIDDFAIIKKTDIDFGAGLNVITGETGAGKSIVIEAMSLALGGRADSSYVRRGTRKAKVQLVASDVELDPASGIETGSSEDPVILSREVSAAGKNLCRVNGDIVTRSKVAAAGSRIADIHGQYDNQALLDPEKHLDLVDAYHKKEIAPKKEAFRQAFDEYRKAHLALVSLVKNEKENRRRLDFYRYETKEIDDARLRPGEDEELEEQISLLRHSEKIFSAAGEASRLLSGGDGDVMTQLGEARQYLESIREYSQDLKSISDDLSSSFYDLQDVTDRIHSMLEDSDFQQTDVDRAISRLDRIDSLKKKYGETIEEILAYRDRTAAKLGQIENFEEEKAKLDAASKAALAILREKADQLTQVRTASAKELSEAIQKELHDLNFPDAKLKVDMRRGQAISQNGQDECEIMISTNIGEPLKPLAKTASGGEISRVMLAIRNVTGNYDNIPTMIFDEIDTGISGITASVVARKLREISRRHQIICITHLPQIAAAGDVNFRIYKDTDGSSTFTHVERLTEAEKTDEIARLLGGDSITGTTRKSAEELIQAMK